MHACRNGVKKLGMKPTHKRRSGLLKLAVDAIACWMAISLGWAAVQGGEPSKDPAQASEAKQTSSAALAIPDSEIIPRAEQAVKSLQKMRSEVAADSTLRSIQRDFTALAGKSELQRETEADTISKARSVQRFNEIQREWSLEQSQLQDWDEALSRRSRFLVAREKDTDQILEIWSATQAAVARKFLFKAVLQRRVEDVLREAQATRLAIQEQTTNLLKLQSQVADRLATLGEIRKEIDQAREKLGQSLLTPDSPPLWQALLRPEVQETIIAEASSSARKMLDDFHEFLQKYSDRIPLHVVLFLGLVALFYFLGQSLSPETAQRLGAVSAIFVLDRPFSSSLLLALIPSAWFYPGVALGILRTAMVPTVIPVVRLLPGLLPQVAQRWVYLLVGLYGLDYLRYLLPEDWLLKRVLLLLIATGACAGLGLFLRSPRAKLSVSSSRERLILLVVRLLLVLFAVGIASNLVGNMTLAEILVVLPVRIIYLAALIFAGAHLLMTLAVVAMQSPPARLLRSVREHGDLLASRCRSIIRIAAVTFWAGVSLYVVGVLGDIGAAGAAFFQLRGKVGATEISVEGLAIFLSVIVSTILVARLLRFVLTEEVFPRVGLPRGVPAAVDVLSRYGVLLLGFLIALAAAGVDFSKVTLLISALGVGIGFGLQNLVNNFVSGLILVFEHPIQVGDHVEVSSLFGEVRKIGFRASVLRTPDGADVIVPNSELIGARVINWTLFDRLRRINISVSTAYGTDPDRVIEILVEVARKHHAVLADPAPEAVFDRFGDSALNFTLLCWSFVDKFFLVRSELTIAINSAFEGAGIQIPFPQQDVHIHWPDGIGAAAERSEAFKDLTENKNAESPALVSRKGPLAKK
jgi:small-conductance mechanosensitive channel